MIIHIAAYPNSKDYLLLEAFYKLFGIPWYEADIADQTDLKVTEEEERTGFRSAGEPWRVFYDRFHEAGDSFVFARTRRLPEDKHAFVYVSRNPVSLVTEKAGWKVAEGAAPEDALVSEILGLGDLPDWTAHYRAWSEHNKGVPGCFVRVEDFCTDPVNVLVKIAARVLLPQPEFIDSYACSLPPDFFEEFAQASPNAKKLLFALHGQTMKQIGYLQPSPEPGFDELESLPPDILAQAVKLLREDDNANKIAASGRHVMARYIESLEYQYRRDTERLVARIKKLSGTS
jgi:hypothetical protein